ncbi:MAG: HDOD domain-containing protein [Oligoflexales bacterium]|nr:HDOD domain-containing protein [Oligoflexales bacterium]
MIVQCGTCDRIYNTEKDLLDRTSCFKICSEGNLWFECSCHSCIMIPKGEHDWYSPSLHLSEGSANIFEQISNLKNLPRVSSNTMKIQEVLNKPDVDSATIERAIKTVPPIALNVVDIANNMSPGASITSLQHAITYVGQTKLREIVYMAGVKSNEFKTQSFYKDQFWHECSVAGVIAEYLARKLAPQDNELPDKAHFAASMANIGKVVSAILFPEVTDQIYLKSRDPKCKLSWSALQKEFGAYSHVLLGEIAGVTWGLPTYAIRSIRFHNESPEMYREEAVASGFMFDFEVDSLPPEDAITLHDIVCIALPYSHWVLLQPHRINQEIFDLFLKKINIDEAQRDQIGEELCEKFIDLA